MARIRLACVDKRDKQCARTTVQQQADRQADAAGLIRDVSVNADSPREQQWLPATQDSRRQPRQRGLC